MNKGFEKKYRVTFFFLALFFCLSVDAGCNNSTSSNTADN